MTATKFTVTVTIECLSKEVIPGMIREFEDLFSNGETPTGTIIKDDGDTLNWYTDTEFVDF